MPRGRAGLSLIYPDKIKEAIGYTSQQLVAEGFHVTTRTVRRWCRVGMSPGYGGTNPSREQWEVFAATRHNYSTADGRNAWHAHSMANGKAPDSDDWYKPAKKAKRTRRK